MHAVQPDHVELVRAQIDIEGVVGDVLAQQRPLRADDLGAGGAGS